MGDNGLGLAAGKYFFKNKVQEKYEKKGKEKKRVSRLKNTFFFYNRSNVIIRTGNK